MISFLKYQRYKDSGVEWIGEIPEYWEVKRISHLGLLGNGSTPARSNPRYWNSADYPWLNSGSVNQGIITEADQFVSNLALKEGHLPLGKPGSIVIAITGQGKIRGTAALLKIPATINQHLTYIEIQTPVALPELVHLAMTSQYRQLRAISESGSTKGALTCQDVKEFKIVPPNECCGGNPKRLSGPAKEQDGLILWKQETVRSRWVTDRTSRSKSQPKKARLEVFPKEERPRIGVEPQNPHLGEKHPNSPLDPMGDPDH